jgi:hypothetical protein
VLNKRIELLERALQGHDSESSSPSTPVAPASRTDPGTVVSNGRKQNSSSGTGIDVNAVRNAEGLMNGLKVRMIETDLW